jgi:A/G-specific adenine glycosylase
MWDFPRFAVSAKASPAGQATQRLLRQQLRAEHGVSVSAIDHLTTLRHSVTRFRITLECYQARHSATVATPDVSRWVKPDELGDYALSVTGRKLARLISAR